MEGPRQILYAISSDAGHIIYVIPPDSKCFYSIECNEKLFHDRSKVLKLQRSLRTAGGRGSGNEEDGTKPDPASSGFQKTLPPPMTTHEKG